MHDSLLQLFRFKASADDELLTVLANLGDESQVSKLALQALSHTYVVDRIFAAHLRRQDHDYSSANLAETPTLAKLSAALKASDQEYVEYVWGLDRDQLAEWIDFTFTDGNAGRMSREEMLLHVITHGVGHRGQISAVMLLNSLPPARDGFTTFLHEAEPMRRAA